MEFFSPGDWQEALEIKAAHPGARPIAGGTDMMVELNFDHDRPEAVIDLTRVRTYGSGGLKTAAARGSRSDVYANNRGAGDRLPGLAMASRTVGSPQIRNRGTVGGNLVPPRRPATVCHPYTPRTPRSKSPLPAVRAASR